MVKVKWTPLARSDVENLFHYYEDISIRFAETIIDEIFKATGYLEMMPEL